MEYITMPTKEDFFAHTGDKIDGLLETDYKNQDDATEVLFKKCYRDILYSLKNIKTTDLTADDLANWHILIIEQAEYYLSLGDSSLTGKKVAKIRPGLASMAHEFYLWNRTLC